MSKSEAKDKERYRNRSGSHCCLTKAPLQQEVLLYCFLSWGAAWVHPGPEGPSLRSCHLQFNGWSHGAATHWPSRPPTLLCAYEGAGQESLPFQSLERQGLKVGSSAGKERGSTAELHPFPRSRKKSSYLRLAWSLGVLVTINKYWNIPLCLQEKKQ